MWDAVSGYLLRTYSEVMEDRITAACLDDLKRKVFVGDSKGKIKVYNFSSGAFLRELTEHTAEISGLYFSADKMLISTSWDGRLVMHDDQASKTKPSIMRTIPRFAFNQGNLMLEQRRQRYSHCYLFN